MRSRGTVSFVVEVKRSRRTSPQGLSRAGDRDCDAKARTFAAGSGPFASTLPNRLEPAHNPLLETARSAADRLFSGPKLSAAVLSPSEAAAHGPSADAIASDPPAKAPAEPPRVGRILESLICEDPMAGLLRQREEELRSQRRAPRAPRATDIAPRDSSPARPRAVIADVSGNSKGPVAEAVAAIVFVANDAVTVEPAPAPVKQTGRKKAKANRERRGRREKTVRTARRLTAPKRVAKKGAKKSATRTRSGRRVDARTGARTVAAQKAPIRKRKAAKALAGRGAATRTRAKSKASVVGKRVRKVVSKKAAATKPTKTAVGKRRAASKAATSKRATARKRAPGSANRAAVRKRGR
jgi:hypothetical protein